MNKEVLTSPVLEALLQAPSLAVTAVDKQGCVILWSPSASRMFGWTESEALGHFLPIMPQDQRQEFLDRMENGIKGGTLIAMESRRLRKDGTLIDVNLWTAPLKDGKGDIIGILGVHADVTARKKTELALHETQAELHRTLAAVSDYLWSGEIDPEGHFHYRYYSPVVERITGRPADFYMAGSERWMSTVHPEDRARLDEISARLLSGQLVSSENEHRIVLPDGTIRWVRANVTVSQSADGYRRLDGVVSDITARKQAEEALQESEARFRGIFTAAASGIVLVSPEGRFLHANPAFCEFLGYSEQELSSKRVQDVTYPDDRERTAEIRRGIWEGKKPLIRRYEKRYLRKDGQTAWGEVSISLIRDAMGNANYSIAQVLDISERKRVEMALQESEERFRALIEHSFDAVAVVKADGTTQFASASMARVLGYQPQEWVGRNALELVHPEDLPRVTKVLDRLLETPGGTMTEQFRCRHNDGSWRWVESLGTNCLAQPAVGGIILNFRDITERKRADEALRESEERYRLMAEAIPQPAWRTNAQGEVTECNGRWYEYTGQTPEEARGNGWMKALHPDDAGCVMQKVQDDVAGGERFQVEYRLRRTSDGSYRWHIARGLPIKDMDGRIVCWFGSAADIEDQKRAQEMLEERVRERTAELAESNLALRNSEAKYRTLVEELPAITYIAGLDEGNTTLYISPQVKSLLGLTPGDYKADPDIWRQHVHPDDLDRVMAEVRHAHMSGEPLDCEYRLLNRTGGIVWIRDKAVVVRDETGQPLFLQGVMLDVPERRQAEETMRLQSAALEAAANGIVITDCEGHILWANPAFAKLTGYELSEVIGKNSRVLKSGQHDKAFYQNLWHTVLSGQVWHGEMVNKRKDGSLYTEEMTITPVRNAAGEITHFIAIKRDITEWKLAEESRRHLAAIVESSNDAIISADLDGIITSWNAAAQRLYNYAPEEIVGRSFFVLTPPNRMGELHEMHKKVQGGENAHFETVRLRKGGFPVNVSITVSPTKNGAGEVIGTSAIIRDITERKELEEAVVEASSREQRRIGHDLHDGLCQQLTGISLLWKAIAQSKGLRALPEVTEVTEITQLIAKTIGEARDLARGLCPVELERNDLGVALKKLGSLMERLFPVSCVVRCQQSVVLADKTAAAHLYRIAQEAISNAIHHGKAARVWIHITWRKDRLTLRIRDNGSGFSKRRGFKEGIGMRSMKYRAQVIGGSLTVESKRGAGTTVACVYTQPRSRFAGKARRRTLG